MKTLALVLSGLALFAACDGGGRGFIHYVPGDGFEQDLEIRLGLPEGRPIAVGEWVDLSASRRSGPWVLEDTIAPGRPPCRRISPATEEYEVAEKVSWQVEPGGQASFGNARPPELRRQIRFTAPGTYQVWATSEGCGEPFVSDRLEVVVQ